MTRQLTPGSLGLERGRRTWTLRGGRLMATESSWRWVELGKCVCTTGREQVWVRLSARHEVGRTALVVVVAATQKAGAARGWRARQVRTSPQSAISCVFWFASSAVLVLCASERRTRKKPQEESKGGCAGGVSSPKERVRTGQGVTVRGGRPASTLGSPRTAAADDRMSGHAPRDGMAAAGGRRPLVRCRGPAASSRATGGRRLAAGLVVLG
jgi:hypothetical protein